ncbi:hydroxymethylglutaryl-CoA lyase [Aminivibrio sp.]|jgi:hydroxymethylglutaryl-CoA lyase|uniref:hydroxymethylglutaryl-CoA lyase n=1 Tax=Aminivibrio sp. TaxID=1872489 RepID=UPI001A59B7A3|nr:hydroxymethylglutaryl-CoA lyase [Aminivibrio sp.]MBL3538120.1 hydroxymethylglutaryl-CoA lyase [Aminivibrio sp.]MDK2959153.1 hydroxymethylglutaryl-CoA lyase [Synergistaceae bacterium]
MAFLTLPDKVEIMEVCPRDGFQSVKEFIPTEHKVAIIDGLAGTGISSMEVTSFVSPKAIPQMADAADVLAEFKKKWKGKVTSIALIPNLRGAEGAMASGVDWMNFVISASEAHNQANTKRTVDESIAEMEKVAALKGSTKLRVSVATAFACPFAGPVAPEKVVRVIDRALEAGADGITMADTIGTADPKYLTSTLSVIREKYGDYPFTLHLHDTYGMALANMVAAMGLGIASFDAAAGGLGGCPFAPGAAGNAATEDMVNMAERMGISTGIDILKVLSVVRTMESVYGLKINSHLAATKMGRDGGEGCCSQEADN